MEVMKKSALHKAVVLAMTTTALVACGSSSDDNNDESVKRPSSISKVETLAVVAGCDNGGQLVHSGIDDNGNGVLDQAEIDNTVSICNGADGSNGTDGSDGQDLVGGVNPNLKRLATAPVGAEFTGMFLNEDGTFFLNVQHPSTSNTAQDAAGKTFDKGTVGVIVGHDFTDMGEVAALDLPITEADKQVVKTAVGSYQVLLQQGETLDDGNKAGDIVTKNGSAVIKNSNDPDFNGVVPAAPGSFYVYSNWEDRPGGMSRILVSGLGQAGYSTVTKEGMLDFSSVDGTWVNCFGTVSPWSTPLSAEELYFDNTADWFDADYKYFSNPVVVAEYLGYPTDGSGAWGNPYNYGYNVEIGTNNTFAAAAEANVEVEKRFALGRFSHENAVVLADNRTVLQSDDGSNVIFYKFVADVAGDLSAGTLYAAKVTQAASTSTIAEAAFAIDWIELGSATDTEVESWIDSYDNATLATPSFITDQQINDWAESKKNEDLDGSGSIAANPFNDDRPAFLESRKAAKALGATAEFNKMEGVNINYDLASNWWSGGDADGPQAYAYMAMSTIGSGMTDEEGDIQIDDPNAKCGAVYRMKLVENNGLVDVQTMVPAIVGGPYYSDRAVNECDVNNISNPDNIEILNDGRVLIGEDTGNHENNVIWLFDDPATNRVEVNVL